MAQKSPKDFEPDSRHLDIAKKVGRHLEEDAATVWLARLEKEGEVIVLGLGAPAVTGQGFKEPF